MIKTTVAMREELCDVLEQSFIDLSARELEMASEMAQDTTGGSAGLARTEPAKAAVTTLETTSRRFAVATDSSADSTRLPRTIAGGFRGIGDDLERRAREWRGVVRLLQQQGPQFEASEAERERLQEQLGRVVAEINENSRSLKSLLAATKNGDASGNLSAGFAKSAATLEDLETIAEQLSTNLAAVRSNWEQYARTVIRAQKMRDELKPELGER